MSDPPTPDSLLKSALIQRACEDVRRVIRIRDDKPAMQNLLQKGVVGDDLWTALLAAEKELEAEILEVIHEANSFMMGWGQFIFSTAGEMVHNEKVLKWMQDYPKLRSEAGSFLLLVPKSPRMLIIIVSLFLNISFQKLSTEERRN